MKHLGYIDISICLILFSINLGYTQEIESAIGEKITISSTILKAEREIQIFLPTSYATSTTEYPVLYLLNGKRWFLNGVSIQHAFTLDPFTNAVYQGLSPEFIVVGITTDTEQGRQRYNFYTNGSQQLRAHLEEEIFTYVDQHYRTSAERMLFGWEYAGAFAIETLFINPKLFDAYFVASPFPLTGERMQVIDSLIPTIADLPNEKYLYFATSPDEGQVSDGAAELDRLLQTKAPQTLRWSYEILEYEQGGIGHLTTPFETLYQGLRGYYQTYPDYNRTRRETIIAIVLLVVILIAIVVLIVFVVKWFKKRLKKKALASKTITTLLLLFGLFSAKIYGQDSNYIKNSIPISSKILAEERKVQVFLPLSYSDTSKQYPVLYLLNGEKWFLHGVNLQHIFSDLELTPEFIVVGINTQVDSPIQERYNLFTKRAPELLGFLEREVIPEIDQTYRTSKERMLFGWEYAGAFVIESLFQRPSLFDAYISASPFPLLRENRIDTIAQLINKSPDLDAFLYVTTSPLEGPVITGVDSLVTVLKDKDLPDLKWEYEKLTYEKSSFAHTISPYGTLYKGLRHFYYNYPRLEFAAVKEFETAGGLRFVHSYYMDRAKRFQIQNTIPTEGMFSLVRMALQEDDYKTFDILVTDFSQQGFIESLNPRTAVQYASYYLSNRGYSGAQKIYESLMKKYPDEPTPINGLGNVYAALEDKVKAMYYYKKAIALAKRGNHPNLTKFESDLQSLK